MKPCAICGTPGQHRLRFALLNTEDITAYMPAEGESLEVKPSAVYDMDHGVVVCRPGCMQEFEGLPYAERVVLAMAQEVGLEGAHWKLCHRDEPELVLTDMLRAVRKMAAELRRAKEG